MISELLVEGETDSQTIYDLPKPHLYLPKLCFNGLSCLCFLIQVKKKIRYLYVVAESLTGRGYDDEPPGRIAPYNIADLADLTGVRD